ncbi:MAG: hypothetical protein QOJ77_105, partial [Microbacteriaceae bacterium]|nr:hypothetical protein [Microbacteriaceae bacterium]
ADDGSNGSIKAHSESLRTAKRDTH